MEDNMATATTIKAGDKVDYVYDAGKSGRAWEGIVLAVVDGYVMVSWDAVRGKPRPHVQANPIANVKVAAASPAPKDLTKKAPAKEAAKAEAPRA
jgi:hypothetical protein